jgi:hypothetical protein
MSRRSWSRSGAIPQSSSTSTSTFASRPKQAGVRAVGVRESELLDEPRHAAIRDAVPRATRLLSERAGEVGLSRPVAPVMITLACDAIHVHVPSWRMAARSISRFRAKSMSSMHAFGRRSFAAGKARARRLLSRERCSASTSRVGTTDR